MRIKMSKNKWVWPFVCAIILGGLIGGITESISAFCLFGVIGWIYAYSDIFHSVSGIPTVQSNESSHGREAYCTDEISIRDTPDSDMTKYMSEDYYGETYPSSWLL